MLCHIQQNQKRGKDPKAEILLCKKKKERDFFSHDSTTLKSFRKCLLLKLLYLNKQHDF